MQDNYSKILSAEGFKSIQFLKESKKNRIYFAKQNNEAYFLKMTTNPANFDNIKTEVVANNFLHQYFSSLPDKLPFRTPKSDLIETPTYLIGRFERLNYAPLASQEEHKIFYSPNEEDLSTLFAILNVFSNIKKKDVPLYLLNKPHIKPTRLNINKKMQTAFDALGDKINTSQKKQFAANASKMKYSAHFNHHDFIPWNMFKDEQENFILVDSEFARWGIKWYDEAYFFLQTCISLESPELAKKSLNYFITHFKNTNTGKNIESEIMIPLHYIILPSVLEAKTKKRELLAKDMLNKILTTDISEVLK